MTAPQQTACGCGCGGVTGVVRKTHRARGLIAGQSRRFLPGHWIRTRPTVPAAERFWTYVARGAADECWNWTGYRTSEGYGRFVPTHGKPVQAHRFAFEQLVSEIPPGLDLDHLCRNTSCVNPWHCEPVTRAINVARANRVRPVNQRAKENQT